jgi:hypothetical protein
MEHPMPFADVLCKNPACEVEPRSSEPGPAGLQDLQISPICHGTATSSNTGFQADVGSLADASSDFLTHLPAVAEHNKRRQEQVQGVKPHGMGNPPAPGPEVQRTNLARFGHGSTASAAVTFQSHLQGIRPPHSRRSSLSLPLSQNTVSDPRQGSQGRTK